MFTHAGVHLDRAAASECVAELRRRIRSPALEYKANHLLREKHRAALEWFLGAGGPIDGHAHVHLVDKTLFLIARVVELLAAGGPPGEAVALYRHVRTAAEPQPWAAFLLAANDVLRPRTRQGGPAGGDALVHALETVGPGPPVLARLREAVPRIADVRAHVDDAALDPLLPAIARAVAVWGDGGRVRVAVVHDRQTSLTAERLAAFTAAPGAPASMRLVDSRTDARVQVADFLAGVARRAWSDRLADRGDSGLLRLLAPYADPASIWADPPHATPTGVRRRDLGEHNRRREAGKGGGHEQLT